MRYFLTLGVVALAWITTACSSSDSSGEKGGAGGSAGSGNVGGTGATGGSAGTAGSAGSGGTAGQGGSAGEDTWTNFAGGFFETYCVECHGPGNTKRDYSSIGDVIRDKDEIRCGIATTKLANCVAAFPPPEQFPIDNATQTNPKPDDAARARLVAWIEAGTPE